MFPSSSIERLETGLLYVSVYLRNFKCSFWMNIHKMNEAELSNIFNSLLASMTHKLTFGHDFKKLVLGVLNIFWKSYLHLIIGDVMTT